MCTSNSPTRKQPKNPRQLTAQSITLSKILGSRDHIQCASFEGVLVYQVVSCGVCSQERYNGCPSRCTIALARQTRRCQEDQHLFDNFLVTSRSCTDCGMAKRGICGNIEKNKEKEEQGEIISGYSICCHVENPWYVLRYKLKSEECRIKQQAAPQVHK